MTGTLHIEKPRQRKVARELVVDNFAGGGGASTGIAWAIGRDPDYAINHNKAALDMHRANHPETVHLCEDVWNIDPRQVAGGQPVGLCWFSPDCRHFSRAKGSKPVEKNIRGLAWVAVKWAKLVKPRVIILENVREFQDWGPLMANGRPNPDKIGLTFRRFVGYLKGRGYAVEWRVLDAADYGAPTHRRRLFLVARCDGKPIVWPAPSHAEKSYELNSGRVVKPWRTAAECIDWSLPMKSIFDRKKPLAEKTLRRIAMGIKRYVLEAANPFIVRCDHGGDHFRGQPVDAPLATIAGKHGFGAVMPHLVSGYGEREGQEPRTRDVGRPAPTIVGSSKHALVGAFVKQYFSGMVGKDLREPLPTITARDHNSLVTASIVGVGGRAGQSPPKGVDEPFSTITAKGDKALLTANILPFMTEVQNASSETGHRAVDRPAHTITANPKGGGMALTACHVAHFSHGQKQWRKADEPLGVITAQGNKFGLVAALLVKYYGNAFGAEVGKPLPTVTTKARFAIVVVRLEDGSESPAVAFDIPGRGTFIIADIYLRMFTPRELALCQGFPADYVMTDKTVADQVNRIGNSVPPQLAEAMCRANYTEAA